MKTLKKIISLLMILAVMFIANESQALLGVSNSINHIEPTKGIANTSEYNGMYEAIINRGGGGIYGNRYMVRLHIYRYNYKEPKYRDMYNTKSRKTVIPITVIGKLEVFDNKKGKGFPKTTYFSSISYETDQGLELSSFKKYGKDPVQGTIKLTSSSSSKSILPKFSGSSEKSMKIWNRHAGDYRKVIGYSSIPSFFNEFFTAALTISARSYRGNLSLGYKGYKSASKLYTNKFINTKDTLNVYLSNRSSYNRSTPSMQWMNNLEYEISGCLKNTGYGAHNALIYLPRTKYLKIYLTGSEYSKQYKEDDYFFLVKINRSYNGVTYNITKSKNAKSYEVIAQEEDRKARILEQERYKKQEQLRIEKERQAKIAKQEEEVAFRKIMTETTETGEPTEKQMELAIKYQIMAKQQGQKNLANIDLNENGNSVAALAKLIGMASSTVEVSVKSFSKYGCVRADGKPGFNCDYVAEIKIGGSLGSAYGGLLDNYGSSSVTTARFLKVKGVWTVVEYIE